MHSLKLVLIFFIMIFNRIFVAIIDNQQQPDHYSTLGLKNNCNETEIRKAFRILALEYHPDKAHSNITEDERNYRQNRFIEIQNAHEILSDPLRRQKYDLSLLDITYDIFEDDVGNRYTSAPFKMFARTKKFRMSFIAEFKPNLVLPIVIPLEIQLKDVLTGIRIEKEYYRRVECPHCLGNGGHEGHCTSCEVCHGTGVANHLFSRKTSNNIGANYDYNNNNGDNDEGIDDDALLYEQMTTTTCGSCGGLGCHPIGKCKNCHGRGLVMKKERIFFNIPPGCARGRQFNIVGVGHRRIRPDMTGEVMAVLKYIIPDNWNTHPNGDLEHLKILNILSLAQGGHFEIKTPTEEVVEVTIDPIKTIADLFQGHVIQHAGLGLPIADEPSTRGSLIIQIKPDIEPSAYTRSEVESVLELIGIHKGDENFYAMMGLFRFYDGQSDMDDGPVLDQSMYTLNEDDVEIIRAL